MAINDVDIDMITISNEFPSAKKVLSILLTTKIMKKLRRCVSFFSK